MKRVLSFVIVAAMLLSLLSVSAFATEPEAANLTAGPAQETGMYGGARVGITNVKSHNTKYVVNFDYTEGKVAVYNDEIPGMTYDLETNTCTVTDIHEPDNELTVWYMGNDFKLKVVGECEFGIIRVINGLGFYATSLNIIGDGTLTVNQKLQNKEAILMSNEGTSVMQLDIADSVNAHLYAQKKETVKEGEDEYYPVVSVSSSALTPEQGGAITVGGVAVPEAQSEQIKEDESDLLPVITTSDLDEEFEHGTRVTRKSDPDGVYSMIPEDGMYMVMHYIYVDALGLWMVDYDFSGTQYYSAKRYNKEQFEAEYDYVYGMAPTPITFTDEWQEEFRGSDAVRLQKDGEPDAVYAGSGYWEDYSFEGDPDGYSICRVTWNEKEEIYVEDPSVPSVDIAFDQLEQNGYHVVTETKEQNLRLEVWSGPADEESRFQTTRDVLYRKSEPDALFVQVGTYTSSNSETGITLYRVHYDPANEEHYVVWSTYSEPEYYNESDENLENNTGDFYYAIEEVTQPVELKFVNRYFDFDNYGYHGVQVENGAYPGVTFAYDTSYHYISSGVYETEHTLYKLVYNENRERWFKDTEFHTIDFKELSEIEQLGYKVVKSHQPLPYSTKGRVSLDNFSIYTDDSGNKYFADYNDKVFSYSEDNTITLSDGKYYIGTPKPELSVSVLHDTVHEVVTDNYSYWVAGPEYHHAGGAQPQTFTLSGKLTSYLSESDYVYIKLLSNDNWEINSMVGGGETSYEIPVPAGTYKMTVSKKNHVTREYQFTVTGDFQQDVKICPLGDINGDGTVNTVDYGMANSHARNKRTLTGYAFDCGNVIADAGTPAISTADAGRINSHARNKRSLWTQ